MLCRSYGAYRNVDIDTYKYRAPYFVGSLLHLPCLTYPEQLIRPSISILDLRSINCVKPCVSLATARSHPGRKRSTARTNFLVTFGRRWVRSVSMELPRKRNMAEPEWVTWLMWW